MIGFLEWAELYREFGELASDANIKFKEFGGGSYEAFHPAFWKSGKEVEDRDRHRDVLEEKFISMTFNRRGYTNKHPIYVINVGLTGHVPIVNDVISNGMRIAKAIAAVILKFIVQYKPPALDFQRVIDFAKEWEADNRDAVSDRFLTTLNAAIKRALSIVTQSGEEYMQTGSTIVNKEAATEMMRNKSSRDNFASISQSSANSYSQELEKAKANAIANRQERLNKAKEKDDLWAKFAHKPPQVASEPTTNVVPQIGIRSRKSPPPLRRQIA